MVGVCNGVAVVDGAVVVDCANGVGDGIITGRWAAVLNVMKVRDVATVFVDNFTAGVVDGAVVGDGAGVGEYVEVGNDAVAGVCNDTVHVIRDLSKKVVVDGAIVVDDAISSDKT